MIEHIVFATSKLVFSLKPPILYELPGQAPDKTFNNVHHNIDIEKQNCTGQRCIDCLKCYKHDTTKTIIEAIKLNGRVKKDLPKITVIRKAI